MILVVDASFAAKVMLQEDGTSVAQQWWADSGATWVAPALIGAEVAAALQVRHHTRRFDDATLATASRQWSQMLAAIALHAVDRSVMLAAVDLIVAHGPLRGADACYLAVADDLSRAAPGQVVFASFDHQQRRAAVRVGLPLAPPERLTGGGDGD